MWGLRMWGGADLVSTAGQQYSLQCGVAVDSTILDVKCCEGGRKRDQEKPRQSIMARSNR